MKPLVFVEKPGYRRRRAADAARVLPVFGLLLFLLPLLWGGADTGRTSMFVFAAWTVLVFLAALLSRLTGDPEPPAAEENGGPDG